MLKAPALAGPEIDNGYGNSKILLYTNELRNKYVFQISFTHPHN